MDKVEKNYKFEDKQKQSQKLQNSIKIYHSLKIQALRYLDQLMNLIISTCIELAYINFQCGTIFFNDVIHKINSWDVDKIGRIA